MPFWVGEGPAGTDDVDETVDELDVEVDVEVIDFGAGPRPKFSSMQ